jgi:hypothetical protein
MVVTRTLLDSSKQVVVAAGHWVQQEPVSLDGVGRSAISEGLVGQAIWVVVAVVAQQGR